MTGTRHLENLRFYKKSNGTISSIDVIELFFSIPKSKKLLVLKNISASTDINFYRLGCTYA